MNPNQPLAVTPVASKLKLFFQNPHQKDIVSKPREIEGSIGQIIVNVLSQAQRMMKQIDVENWEAKAQDPSIENPEVTNYAYAVTAYVELSGHSRGLEQSEIEKTIKEIKRLVRMTVGIDLVGTQFLAEAFIALPMDRSAKSTPPQSATSDRQMLIPQP